MEKPGKPLRTALTASCAVFFFGFMFFDGPFIAVDSASYLSMGVFREPGYPLFLLICRSLPFAELLSFDGYPGIWTAIFFQNLLWIFAVSRISLLFYDVAKNTWTCSEMRCRVIAAFTVFCQFAVCLLNRFAARRGAMYANHILTEALAMPLWLLFLEQMVRLFEARDNKRRWILCAFYGLLLIEVRKQMTVALLLWGFATFLYDLVLKRNRSVRRFLLQCLLILAVFASGKLLDRCYHLAVHGVFRAQPGGYEAMLCTLLYMAEPDDIVLFTEEEAVQREWFTQIMAEQEHRGALSAALPDHPSWRDYAAHFADSFDVIGYEIVHPVLLEALSAESGTDAETLTMRMYDAEGEMLPALLRQNLREYIPLFFSNFLGALALSVARTETVLVIASLVLYALFCVFLIRSRDETIRRLSVLVLAGIVLNAVAVSALIFPQSRYMIYSMGLFYAAFGLMMVTGRKGHTDD